MTLAQKLKNEPFTGTKEVPDPSQASRPEVEPEIYSFPGVGMSKNAPTIKQLKIACRHVAELRAAGMTENLAIRNLELISDCYAKFRILGNVNVDYADHYKLWSKAARGAKVAHPKWAYGRYLRVEHGTPRRQFARDVLEAFKNKQLSKKWMDIFCDKKWRVAVITHEEDKNLLEVQKRGGPQQK
jgi:hypothetical protein